MAAAALHPLEELDSLTVHVIIDNELDPISPGAPLVRQSGGLIDIARRSAPLEPEARSGAVCEVRMDSICCGAHGLSLLITGEKDGRKRTVLFDTGPEEDAWTRNAQRLGLTEVVEEHLERVVLSHWHRDHSGGMLEVLNIVNTHRKNRKQSENSSVVVDLHPDRPEFRGFKPPGGAPVSLEADPTFEAVEQEGGIVEKHKDAHMILGDMFLVSGEIPRETAYEKGVMYGIRLDRGSATWIADEAIRDERFLMCKVKGKGIVVFTGCSHAGVVNVSKHARQLGNNQTLYAVMGGFHLADASPEKLQATLQDIRLLEPKVLIAGHCTGWKAKFSMQREFPERLVHCFVGSTFKF